VITVEVSPGRHLADREYFARRFGVAVITIRRHCTPVTKHPPTGHLLYDEAEVETALEHVRPRRKRQPAVALGWRTV
jgi:hypothetical protein